MSVKKFKFVSPGIFLSEVDNSQVPADDEAMGPIIIGRAPFGPAMRPIKVQSFSDYIQLFGNPVPGRTGGDVWRKGNRAGPTYGMYGAKAYFEPNVGSVTYLRLLGCQHSAVESPAGLAGWETTNDNTTTINDNGGAYGLFICQSGTVNPRQGYLGGIFYVESGAVVLTGSLASSGSGPAGFNVTGGTCGLWEPAVASNFEYRASILDDSGAVVYTTNFNFNESSDTFIRKVFNTNPQLTNADVVDSSGFSQGQNLYWLGESYASWINLKADEKTVATERIIAANAYATLVPLEQPGVNGHNKADYRIPFQEAKTGWFFSQDISTDSASFAPDKMPQLFRFHSRDGGRWIQDNLKVSISNITAGDAASSITSLQYGTFSVILRSASDTDKVPEVVERYDKLSLNPASPDYIKKRIGDKFMIWSDVQDRLLARGDYNNQSRYVRIEMNNVLDDGGFDPAYLPFGVYGPPKFKSCLVGSGSVCTGSDASWVNGGTNSIYAITGAGAGISTGSASVFGIPQYTASLNFPEVALRHTSSAGKTNLDQAYFGLTTQLNMESGINDLYDNGYADYLWPIPMALAETNTLTHEGPGYEPQWVFTLDDLVVGQTSSAGDITEVFWISGSRNDMSSITAGTASSGSPNTFQAVLDADCSRFTAPLFGGFDGLDITELEPFRNSLLSSVTETSSSPYYTLRRAMQTVADPEFVECNLITMPGVTEESLTTELIEICEARADALALIDIPNVYTPFTENANPASSRYGSVTSAISSLKSRQLNTSYACTYYPWVQISDTDAKRTLWAPPSVAILGVFATSEDKAAVWFAPAGFNRAGLSATSAIPVIDVSERLVSKDRDRLYEANINPIAKFPAEGIVVFGQKTLQRTQSALDRINVRRLMIYIKKKISRIAATVLFDQNVQVTWNRFLAPTNGFLALVQANLGLTEFKVVLDSTTTTPDLIDQNILYAKIFLKPARAIEFIAVDFVITRTGASFDD